MVLHCTCRTIRTVGDTQSPMRRGWSYVRRTSSAVADEDDRHGDFLVRRVRSELHSPEVAVAVVQAAVAASDFAVRVAGCASPAAAVGASTPEAAARPSS